MAIDRIVGERVCDNIPDSAENHLWILCKSLHSTCLHFIKVDILVYRIYEIVYFLRLIWILKKIF